jgi:hypothetical protein
VIPHFQFRFEFDFILSKFSECGWILSASAVQRLFHLIFRKIWMDCNRRCDVWWIVCNTGESASESVQMLKLLKWFRLTRIRSHTHTRWQRGGSYEREQMRGPVTRFHVLKNFVLPSPLRR